MPTYDYECDACGHAFEHFQSITSDVLKKCPECKKNRLRRLFGTGAAIVFKGSGFYTTDYRSESYKKGEKKANDAKSEKKDSKSDKKSDSKPAKSESKSEKKSTPKKND